VRFTKREPLKTKKVALDVTLRCEMLEFWKSLILCKLNVVDFIFRNIFFKVHIVDMSQKPTRLVLYHNGKEVVLKFKKNSIDARSKLNLVFVAQSNDGQFVVVV
jgi:hypothetical protein